MTTKADRDRLGVLASMQQQDHNIDRRNCRRIVPMQVLSLGAPRTATLSMREALLTLGYAEPYHFASVLHNVKDADMWLDAIDAKYNPRSTKKPFGKAEFDQLLGHSSAILDVPPILFWRELMEAYPEAKVVLISRNEESWLRSYQVLIRGILNPVGRYILRYTDPYVYGRITQLGYLSNKHFLGLTGPLTIETAMAYGIEGYRAHYEEIRRTVPPERLLEYQLGTGWEPLCKFLGKEDIPKIPFPHQNDGSTLQRSMKAYIKMSMIRSLRNAAVVLGMGASLYFTMRSRGMLG